jgi:hypothetical protein
MLPRSLKKKLQSVKTPLPTFRSNREAAKYFETYSVANVWDHLPVGKRVKLTAALTKSIQFHVRYARAIVTGRRSAKAPAPR